MSSQIIKSRRLKYWLITGSIFFIVLGCISGPPKPQHPTTDPCLALHTIGLPQCRPPADFQASTVNPPGPTAAAGLTKAAPEDPLPLSSSTSTLPPKDTVTILVDDFTPQPYQGDTIYFYNRLEGDRGALNSSNVSWDMGTVKATITPGNIWGGLWMSLNHPIREQQSIDFSAVLPSPILPEYQSQVTGIHILIADGTPLRRFRAELKDSNNNLVWSHEISLQGGPQAIAESLPALREVAQLVLVLDESVDGDFVVIDNISLTATMPFTDTATAAFVWSYAMLLDNWDPDSGLVRDKAKDARGEFDAVQATGSLAAATALAEQVGIIDHADAVAIVNKISDTLLHRLPRNHGLWPHWVRMTADGVFEIVPGTEWSSVDTVIAAIGLLDAQQALGLEPSATEQMLRDIEWKDLLTEKGISHGYTFDNTLIPYAWDVFGGESWLVEFAYASATGKLAPLAYPTAPTANGSGFIDELAWLYVRPPTSPDYWETDWTAYRSDSAEKQMQYFSENTSACVAKLGLFGLSAAEVPAPARVPKENIYQAFGIGGQFAPVNDGTALLGSPVITPHYSAMIASLAPKAAIRMWSWLIASGYFSPLNNVESLAFPMNSDCAGTRAEWNQLKGSWNLALQALGWGRYLAERDGTLPAIWQATTENPFLERGYQILAPNE